MWQHSPELLISHSIDLGFMEVGPSHPGGLSQQFPGDDLKTLNNKTPPCNPCSHPTKLPSWIQPPQQKILFRQFAGTSSLNNTSFAWWYLTQLSNLALCPCASPAKSTRFDKESRLCLDHVSFSLRQMDRKADEQSGFHDRWNSGHTQWH